MPITFTDTHFWTAAYRSGLAVSEFDHSRRTVDYDDILTFSLIPKKPGGIAVSIKKPPGWRMFFGARRFGDLDMRSGIERDEGTDYEMGLVTDDGRPELVEMERGGIWPDLDFSKGFWLVLPRSGEPYLRAGTANLTKIGNNYLFEVI